MTALKSQQDPNELSEAKVPLHLFESLATEQTRAALYDFASVQVAVCFGRKLLGQSFVADPQVKAVRPESAQGVDPVVAAEAGAGRRNPRGQYVAESALLQVSVMVQAPVLQPEVLVVALMVLRPPGWVVAEFARMPSDLLSCDRGDCLHSKCRIIATPRAKLILACG